MKGPEAGAPTCYDKSKYYIKHEDGPEIVFPKGNKRYDIAVEGIERNKPITSDDVKAALRKIKERKEEQ